MMNNMGPSPEGDARIVNDWMDSNHDSVVDVLSSTNSPVASLVRLLIRAPEFADWDQDRIEDALTFDSKEHGLMENKNKKKSLTLEGLVATAVRNGIKSAITEASKPKVKRITRSQLAEGVRRALRIALKESGMPGGAMPAPGMAAGAPMSTPTQEEGLSDGDVTKKGSMSGGHVPSPEELQSALDEQGGWDMNLQGKDSLAFSYALEVAGIGHPNMDSGEGMHAVLTALSQCPAPDELPHTMDDSEIEDPHSRLNRILDSWENRYGHSGDSIIDAAQSIASGILDALGWEWI